MSKLVPFTFTWWQPSASHTLVHPVDVVVQVARGGAHHADARARGEGVQVAAVVVPHGVPILHDGRAAAGAGQGRSTGEWRRKER